MKITKVFNKYYDLTNFKHPGGHIAIEHSYGRDATGLFKSYHPFIDQNKLKLILEKYEIKELPKNFKLLNGEEDIYKFNYDTEFSNELKEKVKNYFENISKKKNISLIQATKATLFRWIEVLVLKFLQILSYIYLLKGFNLSVILYPLFAWLNVQSFHEASHFALSSNQTFNYLWSYTNPEFSSPLMWYHQHNIGHHIYTNHHEYDPDISIWPGFIRLHEKKKYFKNHYYQKFLILFYWMIVTPSIQILKPLIHLYKKKYHKIPLMRMSNSRKIIHILGRLLYLYYIHYLPFSYQNSIFKGLCYAILPQTIFYILFLLNSQITHLHSDSIKLENDWYKHQILTSTNHGTDKTFNFVLSGALNFQIEHHLFPGINHCHHPYIQSIVQDLCKKYNIIYKNFNGYSDAFLSYYNHIIKMSEKEKVI